MKASAVRAGTAPPSTSGRPCFVRSLNEVKADILCLQEVDASKVGDTRRAVDLERLLEGTPYAKHRLVISSMGVGPADVHNLAVLTACPILRSTRQARFGGTSSIPPPHRPSARRCGGFSRVGSAAATLAYHSSPVASVCMCSTFICERRLAAAVPGQKAGPFAWKTVSGWAEGFFAAAVKRAGQALELRLAIERVFDAEPDARIAVCGDFNAEDHDTALRLACAAEDDTGSGHLAGRVLTPVERTLPADRRFTVLHHGRPQMLDHILASRALFADFAGVEIHNEMLEDELVAYGRINRPPESLHAPVVAIFDLGKALAAT